MLRSRQSRLRRALSPSSRSGAPRLVHAFAVMFLKCNTSHLSVLQYLYTLSVKDAEKANKLKASLPPGT